MDWGVNALVFRSPWRTSPSLEEMLEDREHTVGLTRFLRVGGQPTEATPTEVRIAYTGEALLIAFRCAEENPSFPAATRDAREWHPLINGKSCPDTLFPDQVDVLIQPDMASPSYYQFAATPDGKTLGCARLAGPDCAENTPVQAERNDAFHGAVSRREREWLVRLEIPWETIGGRPAAYFGLLPLRTRWRDGEVSSPVALDFMDEVSNTMKSGLTESPAVDLFIETHFARKTVRRPRQVLHRLPSGVLRWQRPAALSYPDVESLRRIRHMQTSLETPTDDATCAQRIQLTQVWTDVLQLEGLSTCPKAWNASLGNLSPYLVRRGLNSAFRRGDRRTAFQRLDQYLAKLDTLTRWWYADGSPGNILLEEWTAAGRVEEITSDGTTLRMRCRAGGHPAMLNVALPGTGGIRVYGESEGHWRPAGLLPMEVKDNGAVCTVETAEGTLSIAREPFSMELRSGTGAIVLKMPARGLAFRLDPTGKTMATDMHLELDPYEVIYGFGERYDAFDRRGTVLTLWATDDWIGNGIGLRNTTYKPVPVFHSSRGYMLFVNSSYRLRADVGTADPTRLRLTQHGPVLDLHFWSGPPERSLGSYTALTGRPLLPPRWAFEPWMGRGSEAWAGGSLRDSVLEEKHTITEFAKRDIPHSAIFAEGPSALSADLHAFSSAKGVRVLSYFMPAITEARQESLMPRVTREGLPVLRCADAEATDQLGYVDFSHPNAAELCRLALKPVLDLGATGSMVDFGDMVPDDAIFADGARGDERHNSYSFLYHQAIHGVWQERRGDDFVLFGRAAAPGTQRYVAQFAGDHPANFRGLRAVVTGAMSLCSCGFSSWGSDIGGYFGLPEPAVFARWVQFGCFSALMRAHGKTPRDPWHFGERIVQIYRRYAWVRESLLDYIYGAAWTAHQSGVPIMRAMALGFPAEPMVAGIADQYLFGRDLLVAPVVTEDECREVAFPSGTWTGLWDGTEVSGPRGMSVKAPLDTIPVYLREGAVVPVRLSRDLRLGESLRDGHVRALIVTPPRGEERAVTLQGEFERVSVSASGRRDGYEWRLENLGEVQTVLVYGLHGIVSVLLDGKEELPHLRRFAPADMTPGWHSDTPVKRLLVRLPAGRSRGEALTLGVTINKDKSNACERE